MKKQNKHIQEQHTKEMQNNPKNAQNFSFGPAQMCEYREPCVSGRESRW